jgi:hypothetical protein
MARRLVKPRLLMCRLCFAKAVLRDGVICETCIQSGPRAIARHHGRRAKELRRRAQLLAQDARWIELVAAELERSAGWLKTVDRRTWRSTKNFPQLLQLAMMDSPTEELQ